MRNFTLLAAALSASIPSMAVAQRYGGEVVYFEEDVVPADEEPAPATTPAPAPTPVPVVTPPPIVTPPVEDIKEIYPFEDRQLDKVTSTQLERFSSEREFQRYIEKVDDISWDSRTRWSASDMPVIAAMQVEEPAVPTEEPCTDPQICPPEDAASADVVVSASKVSSPPSSVTNVQSLGVDEGDIVKQIGDYLLVLQDGRIFVTNIKTMQVTDRADVYRRKPEGAVKQYAWEDDFDGADWYDEMLVQDDHVIITAYSYDDSASETSIFKLDQATGKVTNQGIFLISSSDYYSSKNYATRIVGDKLVVYTPFSVDDIQDLEDRPVIRRWLPEAERNDKQKQGRALFDARGIYKPLLRTGEPTIHAVSICPLGDFERTRDLECKTTAFAGPQAAEMYVSPDNVYLWNSTVSEVDTWSRDDCVADWDWNLPTPYPALPRAKRKDVAPGALYRIPIKGGDIGVVGVPGVPFDQFSMDEQKGEFRALVSWQTIRCDDDGEAPANVSYLTVPRDRFDSAFEPLEDGNIVAAPSPGKRTVENRFTENWLVYGGRDGWSGYPPNDEDGPQSAKVVALPVKNPRKAKMIDLPHNIIRTERVGNDMMLNGYRDGKGLNMTLLGLDKDANVRSTLFLPDRYESEGRSHAFNAVVEDSGSGIIGVPTVKSDGEAGRYWWYSQSSDLSFVTKAPAGTLADAGALIAVKADDVKTDDSYKCEVSCIDWYGNSRPVFIAGRIFGLMATSLVEAKIDAGKISEVGRIDLTAPLSKP